MKWRGLFSRAAPGAEPQRTQVWRRCRRIADGLVLPQPFDAGQFLADLGRRRGRPIELMPVATPSGGPCGLLMSTDHADYILYPTTTTALHRRHIVLHEAGHLLCGHTGPGTGEDGAAIDAAASRELLPSLSPELIRRVLGRTVYTEVQEQEAELLASLIAQRIAHTEDVREPAADTELARLDALFDGRPRRPAP